MSKPQALRDWYCSSSAWATNPGVGRVRCTQPAWDQVAWASGSTTCGATGTFIALTGRGGWSSNTRGWVGDEAPPKNGRIFEFLVAQRHRCCRHLPSLLRETTARIKRLPGIGLVRQPTSPILRPGHGSVPLSRGIKPPTCTYIPTRDRLEASPSSTLTTAFKTSR